MRPPYPGLVFLVLTATACGGGGGSGLDKYLPDTPKPTGEAQSVWAGAITADNADAELIDGPATSGRVGDFYMRNSRARFVVQAPTRVIGVIPAGGNLVDAVPVEGGADAAADHFGELSFIYVLGRTCIHDTVEIVQDGSGGGAAVLRARGFAGANDFINLRGMALLNVPLDLDPDVPDDVECATTYVLEPDASTLQVYFTLYNPGDTDIKGPFGTFNDTGGETEGFSPTRGFERLGISALTMAGDPAPVDYTVYQGPDVAYGILPRHPPESGATNSTFIVAGVSILLYGGQTLLDIINPETFYLELPAGEGLTHGADISVGRDAADAEEAFRTLRGETVAELSGTVQWNSGEAAAGARVGVFRDTDGDGAVGPDDVVLSYMDTDADGSYSGRIPPGDYVLIAEVKDTSRSSAVSVSLGEGGATAGALTLPDPVWVDYEIVDAASGAPIPGKLTVVGQHPVYPGTGLYETYDRSDGVVTRVWSMSGTTQGADGDPRFALPPGGDFRIYASRGTEWSVDGQLVSTVTPGDQSLSFEIARVAAADGYLSSEYHVHQIGSPDSPVPYDKRVMTMVGDGVELWAATDHDYVSNIQPVVEEMGVQRHTRAIAGLETTPFAYGHFNAYPVEQTPELPNFGAVDWAAGMEGYAMIPAEIFGAMRDRGAEIVQVNHPRAGGAISDFMQYFDRAGLAFDYDARVVDGDLLRAPVPNEWLRLPEVTLWDDSFNALEIWNGFEPGDSNQDGVRELQRLDIVLSDWFNFLSFGLDIAPLGNSDTHTRFADPGGMPRTYVRVVDDSPDALASGAAERDALDTLGGVGGLPKDLVVTNGPHIEVTADGDPGSVIGSTLSATGGTIDLTITVSAADWARFDTVEIFANATPDIERGVTALQPLVCATTRDIAEMAENDVCLTAPLAPLPLTVESIDVSGHVRLEATITVTIDSGDIENRAGATGGDAWLVVRARGNRAIFPLMTNDVLDADTADTFVNGAAGEIDALLDGAGIPATAFTAPIYVDFDGGGYLPIFAP